MGIFCPFTPLTAQKWKCQKNKTNTWRYNHLTQAYQKSCSYALLLLWNMAHDRCNCYFSFWAFFALLPLWQPEKWKLQKSEKTPGDIILNKCTKNHDHVLYCSWDMAHDTCNWYFSFWAIFCPFNPPKWQHVNDFSIKLNRTNTLFFKRRKGVSFIEIRSIYK